MGIAVDAAGNAYVVGLTPRRTSRRSTRSSPRGGGSSSALDGFLFKLASGVPAPAAAGRQCGRRSKRLRGNAGDARRIDQLRRQCDPLTYRWAADRRAAGGPVSGNGDAACLHRAGRFNGRRDADVPTDRQRRSRERRARYGEHHYHEREPCARCRAGADQTVRAGARSRSTRRDLRSGRRSAALSLVPDRGRSGDAVGSHGFPADLHRAGARARRSTSS